MTAWLPTILGALDHAIALAKSLGLNPPGADEIAEIKAKVNERLDSVLPLAIVGVAASAVAVAVKAERAIDSLGQSPRCPKCGEVCTQTIAKSVDGPGTVSLSCSCGWSMP